MRYENIPTLSNFKGDGFDVHRAPIHPLITKIDDLITKYHQAFSAMAKRNMLTELQVTVKQWRQAHPGRRSVAIAALEDVIKRRLERSGSVAHTYDNVLCIAYDVTTGGFDSKGKVAYKGKMDDRQDMLARAADMNKAVTAAAGFIPGPVASNTKTLKIFMAPEFYFRGRYGAYPPDVVSEILPTLRAGGTGNPAFKDWLFVFGTAISAVIDAQLCCQTCGDTANIEFQRDPRNPSKTVARCKLGANHKVAEEIFGATIDNVALIQKGAEEYLVAKEYISGIDFRENKVALRDAGIRTELDALPTEGARGSHISSLHNDERMGGCVFTIDGVTFGMEICLDHQEKRLATTGNLQVSLVPSAGMKLKAPRTIPGGIQFGVDGLRPGSEVRIFAGASARETGQSMAVPGASGQVTVYGPFALPWP